jgi:hypothetical protein
MKTFLPDLRNKNGMLTCEASSLYKYYNELNPAEHAKNIAHFNDNRISPKEGELHEPFENWLHTYNHAPERAIATQNWHGKVTAALFAALGIAKPRTKTAMLAALRKPEKYAIFNHCPHLAVDVPAGYFTITARTADGKRFTFAFLPKGKDGRDGTMCVDVKFHDAPNMEHKDGDRALNGMHVVGFTTGHNTFDTRTQDKTTTLLTVLVHDEYYPAKPAKA